MLFNTLEFPLFFALIFGHYLVLPHRLQNRLLLVASYVFYAAWDWRFCFLLALSTVIDYTIGLRMAADGDAVRRRRLVTLSLVSNLGILGFFKYFGFFTESLQDLAGLLGFTLPSFALEVVLPVGISFYTFQTLSYTIDVYRREIEPTRAFLDFALYVSFFPQLVAGPIERARTLLPQILSRREVGWEGFRSGAWLVVWGIYKKVVIADNLGHMVDAVFRVGAEPTSIEVVVATWAFSWQIYCDFSGYTDVARGISRMMGIDIMLNFNLPYAAVNPSDFWRRWHISLSTWLRDYLYVSFGGNRKGPVRTYVHLFLTMLLGGVWHGAAWTFVIWGAYQGVLLMVHRACTPWLRQIRPESLAARAMWRALRCLVFFQFWCFGWLFFRAENLSQSADLIGRLFGPLDPGLAAAWALPLCALTLPLIAMQFVQSRTGDLETVLRWPLPLRALTYAMIGAAIILLGDDLGQPFVYFQF